MTTVEIIELLLGSGGLIGIFVLVFRMGRMVQKIDAFSISFEDFKGCSARSFSEIKCDIKDMKVRLNTMEVQLGKLETRVEERTLRVVQPRYDREPAVR